MPWQRLVADVGLEVDPETGHLAYREVIVTVPRQSGKSTLVLGFETERCVLWPVSQRVAYTAQTGWDARRKLLDDQAPMLQSSKLWVAVERVLRGAGNESVLWRNGSRIDVIAGTSAAGHGRILDLGVIDEAWDDEDDRREQALLPAMATRPDAQLLLASTAGTEASTYLRRKVEAGRRAAETDADSGIAYFEWSVPSDEDIDDPEVWWRFMPALGRTIGPQVVAHARSTMQTAEFQRAFCNRWTQATEDRLIPEAVWLRVQDERAVPSNPVTFAFDVTSDRSRGVIIAAGGGVLELVRVAEGTGWIAGRCAALVRDHGGTLRCDGTGPAVSVADEIEEAGGRVERLTGPQVAAACARLFDAIADQKVRVRPHGALHAAVAGAAKKPSGDRFVWSRTASTQDVTPLIAASVAYARRDTSGWRPVTD